MSIERQFIALHLMALLMFALSVSVYEIFGIELCTTLILTFKKGQGQMKLYQSKTNRRLLVVAIVMFFLPVTVYEIMAFNLSKRFVFLSITIKKQVNILSYNVNKYVIGWRFNSLHNGKKLLI